MNVSVVNTTRYRTYDVLIAGGGLAGITAAISAARNGARAAIIEQSGWLGGQGVAGATGLHSFYNIFGASPGAVRRRLVAGIAQELVDRAAELGGAIGHVPMEKGGDFVSMLTPVDPEVFKVGSAQLCLEAGVDLHLRTVMDEVRAADGHVEGVVVWNKAGRSLIRAAQYVDCTGDGDLAAEAGAAFQHFRQGDLGAYAAGFTFRLCNINLDAMETDLEQRKMITQLAHAVKPGGSRSDIVRLGINMRFLHDAKVPAAPQYFLATSIRPRELTHCNCINYGPNDGLDPDALSSAETDLRYRMLRVADVFRAQIRGCEECYPAGPSPFAGQRRARAIRCHYDLTEDDCVRGRSFEDQVGCFGFIDNPKRFVRNAGAYGIPYRALIPKGLDNVLIAGRMMSVDTVAHNSTRNTACCMVSGEAAGAGAAMAALYGITPMEVDPEELRSRLQDDRVLLEPRDEPE